MQIPWKTKRMQIYKEISIQQLNTRFYLNGQTLQFKFFFYGTLYLQNMYMGSLTNFANKLLKYKPTTKSKGCLETLVYEWL